MAPNFMNVPPEIQVLIGDHLHIRELNSVSCTCRTLNNAFLARLYSHVVIKVPIRWSRLTSLEDLISSAGSGFNFVTSICVTVQQQPSIDDAQESEDGRTAQEIAEERDLGFCLPHVAASKALNALIRLLLMRIPDNHLKHFDWRHSCALETSTLALLSEHQGATLRGFSVTRYSEPQKVSGLLMGGLEGLVITDLNIEQECEWPSTLIAQNRSTLRNLQLGVLSKMARDYAISPRASQHGLPTSFSEWAKEALPTSEGERLPTLPLETLGLYGLNLEFVIGGALGLEIDFNGMTALRLESCSGLEQAFALLRGGGGAYKPKLGSLKPFFLRHEDGSQAFAQHLIIFLTSFAGLIHLSILLDKRSKAVNDESVLNVHGKTLQTLIWDERTGPRTDTKTDTALSRKGRLKRVSMKCPNLTSLGLSLDWSRVTEPCDGTYLAITQVLQRLKTLRTLHIRNLPEMNLNESFLPTGFMVYGLATMVANFLAKGEQSDLSPLLDTIAFGVPVYRDIHIGSNHFPRDLVRDFLQLRVYHVDYNYQPVFRTNLVVTDLVKGSADDTSLCLDRDVLHQYWLA